MLEFVSLHSEQFDNVNQDIIKCRQNENMVDYIVDIYKEFVEVLGGYVKYIGYSTDDTGKRSSELNKSAIKGSKKKKKEKETVISVDKTYARLYVFKFRIKFNGETSTIDVPIYIPLLEDGFHYLIRGNQYCAPFQLIDAVTHSIRKNGADDVVLKTLTRKLKLTRLNSSITDVHGSVHHVHEFFFTLNSKIKKVPFLLFYFAQMGFFNTAEYFGLSGEGGEEFKFGLAKECPIEPDPLLIYFKFGNLYLRISRPDFETVPVVRDYIASVLSLNKRSLDKDNIRTSIYWRNILGGWLSKANATESGRSIMSTFVTALDKNTKSNIEKFIGGSKKDTTHSVVRWMFMKFPSILSKDTNTLQNKRLRLSEYLVSPITESMGVKYNRFQKARGKHRDISRLETIFKVSPTIILDAIIGKGEKSLNIAKYSNRNNDLALFNSILKITKSGPGTPLDSGGRSFVENGYRERDTSYVGNICLITTSNGDPGISGMINPSAQLDLEKMTFKKWGESD